MKQAPISRSRLHECYDSAAYWTQELPRFAGRQQLKADWWAIAAGILATVSGLAIFPVLGSESTDAQQAVVSFVALLAALCALMPRIKNYGEMAGQARELARKYGPVKGKLADEIAAFDDPDGSDEQRRAVVAEFEKLRAQKTSLRYLPDRPQSQRRSDTEQVPQNEVDELKALAPRLISLLQPFSEPPLDEAQRNPKSREKANGEGRGLASPTTTPSHQPDIRVLGGRSSGSAHGSTSPGDGGSFSAPGTR